MYVFVICYTLSYLLNVLKLIFLFHQLIFNIYLFSIFYQYYCIVLFYFNNISLLCILIYVYCDIFVK
jgi:hypothetical protein